MSISNYGIKIYALNSNEYYIIALLDIEKDSIKYIYEIDENNFIFYTSNFIRKVCLNKIDTIKIIGKEKDLGKKDSDFDNYYGEEIEENDSKKILSSLKFRFNFQVLMEYSTHKESYYFSDFVVLKKKYFIIIIENYLFILSYQQENN